MKNETLNLLRCPTCNASVVSSENGKSLFCTGARRHCFDFSKSGYLNLAGPHGGAGDLKEAVRARTLFLNAGYYEPLSLSINRILDQYGASTVLDAGCGEGYYTNRMSEVAKNVIGADLSVAGVDSAAKASKQIGAADFVVASLFRLPVADESLDAVTSIFAPCAEEEFDRILKKQGILILVGAGRDHLLGLKEVLYDDAYTNVGRSDLPQSMTLLGQERLTYEITVEGRARIDALFSMTPYYWRTSERDRAKLSQLQSLATMVDFDIYIYRKEFDK